MKPFLLVLSGLLLTTAGSLACTCSGPPTVQKNFDGATLVFTGKVIRTDFLTMEQTLDTDSVEVARSLVAKTSKTFLNTPMVLKATIVVTESFKGTMKNDTIVIYTGIRGATCGIKFEQNKEYVVYAQAENYMAMFMQGDRERFKNLGKKGTYWANICSRTTIAVGAEQGVLREHIQKSQQVQKK